jgi:hypothetical protein
MKSRMIRVFVLSIFLMISTTSLPIAGFDPIKQKAIKEFHEIVIPKIKEQFASFGASGACAGQIAKAQNAFNTNLARLEAEYIQYWTNALQRNKMGKNQAEYNKLLAEIKDIISYTKKVHIEIQQSIHSRFGFKSPSSASGVGNVDDIKVVIVKFLMQVGTPTAWILLNDLERVNYLL